MYSNDLQLVAPIVKTFIDKCYEIAETSTCNKRKTGAILELPNGGIFFGSSGSKGEPCNTVGQNYCARNSTFSLLEYLTCPSPCAEGDAMLYALDAKLKLSGSKLFTTGFPCQRCKDFIIGFGISEVYFNGYKENSIREHEKIYVAQMVSQGTKVFHLDDQGKLEQLVATDNEIKESKKEEIYAVEFWMELMFNKEFRKDKFEQIIGIINKRLDGSSPE